jgi:hypothetical protein
LLFGEALRLFGAARSSSKQILKSHDLFSTTPPLNPPANRKSTWTALARFDGATERIDQLVPNGMASDVSNDPEETDARECEFSLRRWHRFLALDRIVPINCARRNSHGQPPASEQKEGDDIVLGPEEKKD